MAKDYYAILNISRNATDDQIKKAYRKLAIKYHPDKNKSAAAEERFKEIAEAYELLTDRKKRHIYDQYNSNDPNNDDMSDCRNPNGGIFTYHFHGDPRATFAQFFGSANPFGAFYASKKPSRKFESTTAAATAAGVKYNEADIKATPMPPPPPTTPTSEAPFSYPAQRSKTPPPATPLPPTEPSQPTTQTSPPPPSQAPTHKPASNTPIPAPAPPSKSQPSTPTPPSSPKPKIKSTLKQDPPIEYDLFVSLEDIESGCMKKMRILRMVTEADGKQRKEEKVLNINVKPGWKAGTKITFQREGDRSPGMLPADIIFIIRDKPHAHFVREGSDIRYNAVISLKRALCGCEFKVPTLQGDHIIMKTHGEIIKPNTVKCFKGRGLPFHKEPNRRGDLFVDIVVKFPEALQLEAKEKLNDVLPD